MFAKAAITGTLQAGGPTFTAEYLVVAGGGGGGYTGGGGGAGGYLTAADFSIALGSPYTLTVGAGGAGAASVVRGTSGANSVLGAVTAVGGGGAGSYSGAYNAAIATGADGGSGGGGASGETNIKGAGGAGTASQGNAGGAGYILSSSFVVGGGGGGASVAGGNGNASAVPGDGGDGLSSSITGSALSYAGGGGGGAFSPAANTNGGAAGLGGGGAGGGANTSWVAGAGFANTGGGGGGGGYNAAFLAGAAGGSGVVIIRVPSTVVAEFSAGVVYNYIPLDDFNVYEITAAGVSDTVTFSQGAVTTVGESLRFNDDDSAYLYRTPASVGNRKTYTFSAWVKFSAAATNQFIFSGAGGSARWGLYLSSAGKLATDLQFTGTYNESLATYRDPSAWYHLVWKVDTTAPTAIDRSVIYINGNRIADANTRTLSLNADTNINDVAVHYISNTSSPNWYFDGYMSDVYFIDGEALDPSRFGKQDADGIWQPISYTGSYGTNGFHLDFADNSTAAALGTDTSGNGNDWTPSGITTDDQVSDTPSVNYATLNPLNKLIVVGAGASPTFSDGNLNVNGNNQDAVGTFGVSSGKWYYEVTQQDSGAFTNGVGWYREGTSEESIYRDDGNFRFDGTEAAYGASWQSSGDIIGIALDLDNTTISFYKNGVSQGNAKTNLSAGTYIPLIYCRLPSNLTANFGQRPFAYTPPTGFQALNSSNLPAPTITDGKEHFQPVLYTGNGASQTVRGLEFAPDMVWIKARSAGYDHQLHDTVRGTGSTLFPNLTQAQGAYNTLTAFLSNGFTVDGSTYLGTNGNGTTFVSWNWNAGGSTVTNTDGTITSQVRANTDAGISIVSYTGTGGSATVGHGLGAAPAFIIIKERSPNADNWNVYHQTLGNSAWLQLNLANAQSTGSGMWNNTSPTSTVITVNNPGVGGYSNRSGAAYIGYAFAEVDGFSRFGSYTGNGSADGPFVYTGFRPAFVIMKSNTNGYYWVMKDNKRAAAYNPVTGNLYPNDLLVEDTTATAYIDLLANGFKLRGNYLGTNGSGVGYIFMAFAENPFKTARAR